MLRWVEMRVDVVQRWWKVLPACLALLVGACLDPGQAEQASDTDTESSDSNTLPQGEALEVVEVGSAGFLLRGAVLTPDAVIDPGEVLILGDTITCVAADCSAEASGVTVIETTGVISPGLVDAHNHITYDFLPEWVPDPPVLFDNRYVWSDDPSYEEHIRPYAAHGSTGTHFCPGAKWGELRAIVHGTTTVQGQSQAQGCIDRLARNADSFHGLGYDHMQTTIGSPREITDEDAAVYIENFTAPEDPTTRFAVHMQEGVTGNNVELEFASFAGRDTRENRHAGLSLLAEDGGYRGVAVLIHALSLTSVELQEAAATGSKIVWSPSSNMALYGATAPIGEILQLGITVGLGPDWTVSGEDDMLAEMRFALQWAQHEGESAITPQVLFQMATTGSADAVGLGESIGLLAPGMRADVVVFGRTDPDPYRSVVMSTAADVHLVLIDGLVYYGDAEVESVTALNEDCDALDACGSPKFLCVKNTPGSDSRADESFQDIYTQLYDIMEGIGYPADEQYGRGDEVLPLIACE
jgi:cytosine/adenosine deaminase-related metal-dependent hydrolase